MLIEAIRLKPRSGKRLMPITQAHILLFTQNSAGGSLVPTSSSRGGGGSGDLG